MKKSRILISLLFVMTVIMSSCGNNEEVLMDVPVMSDYVQFDYDGLKRESQIIAKIQVRDDLSIKNTELTYDPYEGNQKSIIGFLAMREVKIIEVYKGPDIKAGDVMEIIEPAGVTKTQLLHDESYKPMERDGVYLVFLCNETASGRYGIISASNGIVDLVNPGNSGYLEIEVKAITEFESDLPPASKDAILQSKIVKIVGADEQCLLDSDEISIKGEDGTEIKSYVFKFGADEQQKISYFKFVQY